VSSTSYRCHREYKGTPIRTPRIRDRSWSRVSSPICAPRRILHPHPIARGCVQSATSREWGKLRRAPARWPFAEPSIQRRPARISHSRPPITRSTTPDDRRIVARRFNRRGAARSREKAREDRESRVNAS